MFECVGLGCGFARDGPLGYAVEGVDCAHDCAPRSRVRRVGRCFAICYCLLDAPANQAEDLLAPCQPVR